MEFEKMKVIWDSQNNEPLYAINESVLHARVAQEVRRFNRRLFWRDALEIGGGIVFAGWLLAEATLIAIRGEGLLVSAKNGPLPLAAGIVCAGGAVFLFSPIYMLVGRKRQRQLESKFESSLRGDLNRALSQVDYQIGLAKSAAWWAFLPAFVSTVLFMYAVSLLSAASWTRFLLVMGLFLPPVYGCTYWLHRKAIRCKLLPRKRDLESLRDTLDPSDR